MNLVQALKATGPLIVFCTAFGMGITWASLNARIDRQRSTITELQLRVAKLAGAVGDLNATLRTREQADRTDRQQAVAPKAGVAPQPPSSASEVLDPWN